ncbi:hypothetical protein D3C85_1240080 [compost metagenome]
MIQCAGHSHLRISVGVLAEQGEGGAVKQHFHIDKSTRTRVAHLVGAADDGCAGSGQRKVLFFFSDDFKVCVVVERYVFLRGQVVGHALEQILGVRLIGMGGDRTAQSRD